MRKWLASGWAKWTVVLLYLTAAVNGFGIINTQVSLKYETQVAGQCISSVTGRDLCADLLACKVESGAAFLAVSLLLALHVWASSTPAHKPD